MSVTRDQMERKLRELNPHWNRQTIEGWSLPQITEIYKKELRRCVASIYASLGLEMK